MAFDAKPSTWLGAGYSADASAHTITMKTGDASSDKTLPLLSDANANATTGNILKLVFALQEALYQAWLTQKAANALPVKMSVDRSVGAQASDGSFNLEYRVSLNVSGSFVAGTT